MRSSRFKMTKDMPKLRNVKLESVTTPGIYYDDDSLVFKEEHLAQLRYIRKQLSGYTYNLNPKHTCNFIRFNSTHQQVE